MSSVVMNWLTENFCAVLADVIGGFLDVFGDVVNNIFYWIIQVATENVYVINAERFTVSLATTLISVCVVKNIIAGYFLETDYDAEEDPFNLLVRIAQTEAFILNGNWIFNFLLNFSKHFTTDLVGSANAAGYSDTTTGLLGMDSAAAGRSYSAYMLLVGFITIGTVIFSVVAGMRGAELVALMLFFPFFCLDMLTNSRERWNNFKMAYMFAAITYSFQILFFTIAMKSYATAATGSSGETSLYWIGTIVFLIMAIRGPKTIEKYLYTSGVSNAAHSGIRMLVQTAAMKGMVA